MKKKKILDVLLILIIFVVLFLIIIYTPIINKYRNNGDLIINEIMASNKNTIIDSHNNSSDYIEIYNGYDYDINLEGYYLSDDNFDTKKWKFPNVTLKAKEYLVVYASGLDKYEGELHTNFKLDSKGEVVTLSDSKGKSLSKVYYVNLLDDTSYGYVDNEYVYFYAGTPNGPNNGEYSKDKIEYTKIDSKLYFTEYMVNNVSAFKSEDGNSYSMIEIYNGYDYDVDLEGYYLSNKYDDKYRYVFPNITLKAKEYLSIYASGLNKYEGELHTNFKLDKSDNVLILSDKFKNELSKIYINNMESNVSSGLYDGTWYYYKNNSIGKENTKDYLENQNFVQNLIINEVSVLPNEAIEIKNISNNDINLSTYLIGDKSGKKANLPNVVIKPNSFYVVYSNNVGFNINTTTEKIYLYDGDLIVDDYEVGKLKYGVSSGINEDGKRVFYNNITLGSENNETYYLTYTESPLFSIDGGYVEAGTKISLKTNDNSEIYYTLDGSFPNKNSIKYTDEIEINKTTVIKAIAYKDDKMESDIVSRTYIVGRKHDIAIVSVSTENGNLFGANGLLTKYYLDLEKQVSFEFYEPDGTLGTSFIAGTKLTGMDSKKREQKSMAIYLRKEYGVQDVTYPFFKEGETLTYSSFTLRNAGEDPFGIRIQDTVMTYALKGQMDIDMQDYRPVVVYLNGEYYGLYNMREKLNSDYVESKYGIEKGNFDLIKYNAPVEGNMNGYRNLVNYIQTHDPANPAVYNYLKTQIDVQELCNYMVVESYYGNTDLGNIRYWKSTDGKWRWMLYDLDWSLWNTNVAIGYPVTYTRVPAATYLNSAITITRRLYRNAEFRDLYLSTFAYHMKNTFIPDRMNAIVDELAKEIESEIPYHVQRWPNMYPSVNDWNNGVNLFKQKLINRYNTVKRRIQGDFNLSYAEYNRYFGGL